MLGKQDFCIRLYIRLYWMTEVSEEGQCLLNRLQLS